MNEGQVAMIGVRLWLWMRRRMRARFSGRSLACLVAFCGLLISVMDGGGVYARSLPITTTLGALPNSLYQEYGQNDILFYAPCDGTSGGGGTNVSVGAGSCAKLAELRQAMWNEASESDKKRFMNVVVHEDASISGVEGYMNQVISKHGNDGSLKDWLDRQCPKFLAHPENCNGSENITGEKQEWVNEALGGSNNIRFAIGNATGGSSVGAGKIVCVWNKESKKCQDVDYNKEGGHGKCNVYAPSASFGECWGLEDEDKWAESLESQCAGSSSVGASAATAAVSAGTTIASGGTAAASSALWENGWLKDNSIPGMKKEDVNSKKNLSEPAKKVGTYTTSDKKPNKILLHATEGTANGYSAYPLGNKFPAHFTIDLKKKEGYQHFSLYQPSLAIKTHDAAGPIQIEIVGFDSRSNPGYSEEYDLQKFGDEEWKYLAQVLQAISSETGIPLKSSVDWTKESRLSKKDFLNYAGVLGHMHAPDNDHSDPGDIWKYIEAVLGTTSCVLNGDENSISGAKNAEKQANEVGKASFGDNNTKEMKTLLENYGDLAYRTGQAYGVPWIAILVQARYEDSKAVCGANNFWGIGCPPGTGPGGGTNATNLGEGFKLYGKTVHNGNYEKALKETDPHEYLKKLGPMWVQGSDSGAGYALINEMGDSIKALTKYIESEEGQQIVAQFGAANCGEGLDTSECGNGTTINDTGYSGGSNAILAAVQKVIDLANENGSTYVYGGGRSISNFKKVVNDGASNNIDCTGFASMVYWMVYDDFDSGDIFSSGSILSGDHPSYVEVKRSEVRPGDIFAYNGHGGIVIEVKDGKVTKIAETGGKEGRSGKNKNIGYSGSSDYSVRHMNTSAGHFFRWKGDNS